jgi:HK97 family phage prohead protease
LQSKNLGGQIMPYFIAKDREGCKSGWAVIDETGDLIACHDGKQSAIDNAVALSIATDEPFEGERAAIGELSIGDYVTWVSEDETLTGEVYSVTDETAQVKIYDNMDGVFVESELLATVPVADLTKIDEPPVFEPEDEEEDRAVNQDAPAYMRAAARRGLEYYEQGLGGDGLVDRTIREARDMADGRVTDDKWVRIAAWIARHLVDLDSPDAQPDSDNYPSAGVVAHLLWGSGPSKRAAQRTLAYAESVVARIEAEQERDVMTTDVRDKWADVAYRIKARLEGGSVEGRSTTQQEKRINLADFEVRETADGMTFEGYAAVFNSDSEPLPFIERIAPGAFKRSLQSRNEVKLLWNHDSGEPLASVRGGTLKLIEDARGLKVQATLANTTRGRDVSELIRSKVIDSMSFGFSVIKDTWSNDGATRTLEAVRLFEVSIVSSPAYSGTAGTVSVRSVDTGIDADQLADALMRLESGEELDAAHATLITDVVAKLTKTEEVKEVEGDILALKKKKLDLLLKEM